MAQFQTDTWGMFQSDLAIRGCIIGGLNDIRTNPWLLDYAFAWLINDPLTAAEYGLKELNKIKTWVLGQDVQVIMAGGKTDPKYPQYSITLASSVEGYNTLGEVHHRTIEPFPNNQAQPFIQGPFTPTAYDPGAGFVTTPTSINLAHVTPGQRLYSTVSGRAYTILDIDTVGFFISEGVIDDFTNATIAPIGVMYGVKLKSALFKETYRIGSHATGDQNYCLYLDCLLRFILLRYRSVYLEPRGFLNTTLSSGALENNPYMSQNEQLTYTRYTTVTGDVRQFYPGAVFTAIQGVGSGSPAGEIPLDPGFIRVCQVYDGGWTSALEPIDP